MTGYVPDSVRAEYRSSRVAIKKEVASAEPKKSMTKSKMEAVVSQVGFVMSLWLYFLTSHRFRTLIFCQIFTKMLL